MQCGMSAIVEAAEGTYLVRREYERILQEKNCV